MLFTRSNVNPMLTKCKYFLYLWSVELKNSVVMKKIVGLIVVGLFMVTTAKAQSDVSWEKQDDQIKMTRYFAGTDQVKEVGYFKDGKSHGQWTEFTRTGDIRIEATYINGHKEGTWFVWADDRTKLYECVYEANRMVEHREWSLDQRNLHVEK